MTRPGEVAESFVAAISRHDPDAVARCFAEDYEDEAPARRGEVVRVPTLLVWGDADARSPMAVAHQLHDAILGARLAVIPGAGHISNLRDPVRFDAHVRDFCLSVSIG